MENLYAINKRAVFNKLNLLARVENCLVCNEVFNAISL